MTSLCRTCNYFACNSLGNYCDKLPTVSAAAMNTMRHCGVFKPFMEVDVIEDSVGIAAAHIQDQSIKQDAGKLDMGAVYRHFPRALKAVAKVREFSRVTKGRHNYTWQDVEIERWRASFERHNTDWNMIPTGDWIEYLKLNADDESGLPQHWHMLTSLMAYIELEERKKEILAKEQEQ